MIELYVITDNVLNMMIMRKVSIRSEQLKTFIFLRVWLLLDFIQGMGEILVFITVIKKFIY